MLKRQYAPTDLTGSASNGNMPKTIWVALEPIPCHGCENMIPVNGLFVRAQRRRNDPPLKGRTMRPSFSYCRGCQPFSVYSEEDAAQWDAFVASLPQPHSVTEARS